MSPKISMELGHITAGAWSGLAAPAVAGAAVHSTTPWYIAIPVLVAALGLKIRRPAGAAGAAARPGRDRPVNRRGAGHARNGHRKPARRPACGEFLPSPRFFRIANYWGAAPCS